MTKQQIELSKYLGSPCEIYSPVLGYIWETKPLDLEVLYNEFYYKGLNSFRLLLTPVDKLTEGDFRNMLKEVYGLGSLEFNKDYDLWMRDVMDHNYWVSDKLLVIEADWLRNNGYYLGEESIKEFVKLK